MISGEIVHSSCQELELLMVMKCYMMCLFMQIWEWSVAIWMSGLTAGDLRYVFDTKVHWKPGLVKFAKLYWTELILVLVSYLFNETVIPVLNTTSFQMYTVQKFWSGWFPFFHVVDDVSASKKQTCIMSTFDNIASFD